MNKQKLTLKDKIDFIATHTTFTTEELLNLPIDIFEKIYVDVQTMREAINLVECDVILYKKK